MGTMKLNNNLLTALPKNYDRADTLVRASLAVEETEKSDKKEAYPCHLAKKYHFMEFYQKKMKDDKNVKAMFINPLKT